MKMTWILRWWHVYSMVKFVQIQKPHNDAVIVGQISPPHHRQRISTILYVVKTICSYWST